MKLLMLSTSILLASAVVALAQTPPSQPAFPPGDTIDVIHGVPVRDPYRALENDANPAVAAWSDAQNVVTRHYLDNLPGRSAVAAKLKRLTSASSPSYRDLQACGPHIFAMYNDPAKQQPSLVRLNAQADPGSRTGVLDPNTLDPTGHTEIDWYVASPDGSKVAVSLSRNGSEDGTLQVFDVVSGQEVGAPISDVQHATAGGSVAWTADGTAFWYTRYPTSGPEGERRFNQQVYFHRLGDASASDSLVLGAADGLPRTAEVYLANESAAPVASAAVQLGDGGQWQVYVLKPGAKALKVARYEDRVIAAVIAKDGTLYGLSRLNAPKGKVLKLSPPYLGGFEKAEVFAPQDEDAAIVDGGELNKPLVVAGGRLVVNRIIGGPSQLAVYDASGKRATVPIPPNSAVKDLVAASNGDVLFKVATYLEPDYYGRWSPAGQTTRTGLEVKSPISFADATVTRAYATSKDGTKVPLNIIAKKDTVLDGRHPVLLYGYGGYGASQTPSFLGAMRRLWLEAGGIYVQANLRGGGEFGEDWRRDGALTHKQNVFDDFAAVADWLVSNGYTAHDRLALMGASNGGLLMGAEITQHPGMARAVISAVGIYDMVRLELDPNGAFNVTEYGTVKEPAQFKALYAYSPYHNVKPGTPYPAVLMLTGANDGRVNPLNSRKFTAALQAATSSGRRILLRTSKTSGHGIGSSLDDLIAEQTDELMFLLDQLGMSAEQATR